MLKRKRLVLKPAGADGSATASTTFSVGKSGFVRAIKVDYQNQPATTDITFVDGYGNTIFTRANSATDIALSPCGSPGVDEGGAATAATDGVGGGWAFLSGVTVSVAQGDGQTSGDEKIVIDMIVEENA